MEAKITDIVKSYYRDDRVESIKTFNNRIIITIIGDETDDCDEIIKNKIYDFGSVDKVTIVHTAIKNVQQTQVSNPFDEKWSVRNVKKIIGVASGKGGVGKSTTAVNLALAIANQGKKVALFDADIYGPSVPTMLGYEGEEVKSFDGKTFEPFMNMAVESMSIGAMVDRNTALIWRGAKAVGALQQLIVDTNWGTGGKAVDVMVIDMPPGTGDIQLSLSQKLNLDGVVVVSTPQDIALIDAIKGVRMFQKVGVPILGIVENMSYYICENCGTRAEIFGHHGAKETAKDIGVKFLGEIPLHIEIRENSDAGTPIVFANPDSVHSQIYENIAKQIVEYIGN